MPPNPQAAWNFSNEREFIATLGRHSDTHKQTRTDLLARYIDTLTKRTVGFDQHELDALREIARHALADEPVLQKRRALRFGGLNV